MLVQKAQGGDRNAVGSLIDRYRNYLLLIANHDVGDDLKAKMGASDAVQESMMHAQLHFDQFQGDSEGELKAWLKTILANDIRKGRRHFNAQKRDANLEVNMQEQSAVGRGLLDHQLTPSSEAIKQEKARAMKVAMERLSAEQQQVIQLRNFERLAFAEIGKEMDRSEDAARKLWARSIEALKQNLKDDSPELIDESRQSDQNHD